MTAHRPQVPAGRYVSKSLMINLSRSTLMTLLEQGQVDLALIVNGEPMPGGRVRVRLMGKSRRLLPEVYRLESEALKQVGKEYSARYRVARK